MLASECGVDGLLGLELHLLHGDIEHDGRHRRGICIGRTLLQLLDVLLILDDLQERLVHGLLIVLEVDGIVVLADLIEHVDEKVRGIGCNLMCELGIDVGEADGKNAGLVIEFYRQGLIQCLPGIGLDVLLDLVPCDKVELLDHGIPKCVGLGQSGDQYSVG